MLRRVRKIACLVLIALLIASTATPALASTTAKVSSSSAKIYKTASRSASSAKLSKGTKVTVKSVSGSWAKVKVSGKTGYMPVKYLSETSSSSASSSASGRKVYTNKSTYVYKSASSSSSRTSVPVNTKLYVLGKSGSYYKVRKSGSSKTGYVKTSAVSSSKTSASKYTSKSSSSKSWKSKVVKLNWFDEGKRVLKKGSYGYIYDIDTGIELKIKRMGGHYHADVEPATAADTAKLLRIAGGSFSWKSHAVILKAGGKYVASAINTLPHGDQTIRNNNYDGQFCLHMTGSWTHASSKENSSHQSSIDRAYRWAHK